VTFGHLRLPERRRRSHPPTPLACHCTLHEWRDSQCAWGTDNCNKSKIMRHAYRRGLSVPRTILFAPTGETDMSVCQTAPGMALCSVLTTSPTVRSLLSLMLLSAVALAALAALHLRAYREPPCILPFVDLVSARFPQVGSFPAAELSEH
jgi:hypothetical protein